MLYISDLLCPALPRQLFHHPTQLIHFFVVFEIRFDELLAQFIAAIIEAFQLLRLCGLNDICRQYRERYRHIDVGGNGFFQLSRIDLAPERLLEMEQRARSLAVPDAAARIADLIEELAK